MIFYSTRFDRSVFSAPTPSDEQQRSLFPQDEKLSLFASALLPLAKYIPILYGVL